MPLVTYIITVFNKRLYLPFVIAGLKSQTGNFEREFIFVDDGSTDDSSDFIANAFAGDNRLHLIRQANRGPASATNAGFTAATGTYVKPVDGDDVLAPWATEALLDAAQRTNSGMAFSPSDLAGLYSRDQSVDAVLDSFVPAVPTVRVTNLLPRTLRRAETNPTSWIAKRDLVDSVGGCDPEFFVQDYSIELRLAGTGNVA